MPDANRAEELVRRCVDGDAEALAGSAETRRRLIEMYQDVRACADGESLPRMALPGETIVPYTEARPSERVKSTLPRAILVGGLAGAFLFWGGALFGPLAWQTPFSFTAVAAIAMVVLHRSWGTTLESMQRTQRRVMQGCLIILAVAGVGLGVLDGGNVPVACSLIVWAIVVLFATVSRGDAGLKNPPNTEMKQTRNQDVGDTESRRRGVGGP